MSVSNHQPNDALTIPTVNQHGRSTLILNEINELFVKYAGSATLPVLDIGSGFGTTALAALESGATVIANDIDRRFLDRIESEVKAESRMRLKVMLGSFPHELDFKEGSLAAVHASNLLNFIHGREIEIGARKISSWLMPGGKVFIISGTPYAKNIKGFIATYEHRCKQGWRWPGECENLRSYSDDPTIQELPDFLHLLDDIVLRRTFEDVGMVVNEAALFHRHHTPEYISYDGRENVCLVATRL